MIWEKISEANKKKLKANRINVFFMAGGFDRIKIIFFHPIKKPTIPMKRIVGLDCNYC